MKRTQLKRTPSDKQKVKDAEWLVQKLYRRADLAAKYDVSVCEFCGEPEGYHEFYRLGGHHLDGNRNNNSYDNFYLSHNVCHGWITRHPLVEISQEDFYGKVNKIDVMEGK